MSSTASGPLTAHPIAFFATRMHAELDDLTDVAAGSAAVSTGAWLAAQTRQPRGHAWQDVTLALALDERPTTRHALAAGATDAAQARVIVRAVQGIEEQAPEAVTADPTLLERAEKHLIALAGEHEAVALRRLGRHVLAVIDPEAADIALGRRLEAEEERAALATWMNPSHHPQPLRARQPRHPRPELMGRAF